MPSIAVGAEEEEEQREELREEQLEEQEEEQEDEEELEARPGRAPAGAPNGNWRVIFFDIDGVLNTRPDPRIVVVEEGPCKMLRRLLDASNAKLVLTSPWRQHHQYILQVLEEFGVFGDGEAPEELLCTPRNANTERRDLEILQWLGAHTGRVKSWVVLEAGDLLRWPNAERFRGHVVRTASGSGLTTDNIEAAAVALEVELHAQARGKVSTFVCTEEDIGLAGAQPRLVSTFVSTEKDGGPGAATQGPKLVNTFVSTEGAGFESLRPTAVDDGRRTDPPTERAAAVSTSFSFTVDLEEGDAEVEEATGIEASSLPAATASDLVGAVRSAASWDDVLAGEMQTLLGLLSPQKAAPSAESSRDAGEFEAMFDQARKRFGK